VKWFVKIVERVGRVMVLFCTQDPTEITTGIRDGSAHVLRCLKVWYDLPSDVLFVAINFMDRFLTKMKVIIVLKEYIM
jgi:hypothetical protein